MYKRNDTGKDILYSARNVAYIKIITINESLKL